MNISARTQTFIDLLPKGHRQTPAMRDAIVDLLGTAEQFAGHKIALATDPEKTEIAKRRALTEAFTNKFGKQLARAGRPVLKARKEIEARRAALVVKPGPSTSAGAIGHMEDRTWLRSLDLGALQGVVLSTEDPDLLHAMLLKPGQSGLNRLPAMLPLPEQERQPVPIMAYIEQRYKGLVYPTELASIAADEAVVAPTEQARHIARNEMAGVYGAHPIEFDKLMQSLEADRPVLTSDRMQIIEIDAAGRATYRPASQSEIDNGVVYGSDEHKAAQGLADAA